MAAQQLKAELRGAAVARGHRPTHRAPRRSSAVLCRSAPPPFRRAAAARKTRTHMDARTRAKRGGRQLVGFHWRQALCARVERRGVRAAMENRGNRRGENARWAGTGGVRCEISGGANRAGPAPRVPSRRTAKAMEWCQVQAQRRAAHRPMRARKGTRSVGAERAQKDERAKSARYGLVRRGGSGQLLPSILTEGERQAKGDCGAGGWGRGWAKRLGEEAESSIAGGARTRRRGFAWARLASKRFRFSTDSLHTTNRVRERPVAVQT